MRKEKWYHPVRFSPETIRVAEAEFRRLLPDSSEEDRWSWSVTISKEEWTFESPEEFYAEYRRKPSNTFVYYSAGRYEYLFQVLFGVQSRVAVTAPTRVEIERVFAVFDAAERSARVPEDSQPPQVFIGHGRSPAWRDLRDHLQDQHGFAIVAYETGVRAGHPISDTLEEMLMKSSFAVLVLTADDETAAGSKRARQNVIHEVGLFQGRLGFSRAIILIEEGVEGFSNVSGIQQIRFASGRIRETFGDVLATIRREFARVV